jgi:N-acetylglutamate synthase-like GNAT family acetyltransferase
MRLVTHFPDTGLRKATGLDFGAIRQLPVQLTQPAASSLPLKQLRMMLQVPDYELTVLQVGHRIAAFMALQHSPSPDSAMRFLVIKYLAIDRFALTRGAAAEMEQHASQTAATSGCAAVLVSAAALTSPALKFYQEQGFRLDGNTLIKELCVRGM